MRELSKSNGTLDNDIFIHFKIAIQFFWWDDSKRDSNYIKKSMLFCLYYQGSQLMRVRTII